MIIQTNIFICEVCDKVESITETGLCLYSDPPVDNPGWNWILSSDNHNLLACEECMDKLKLQKFPKLSARELRQVIGALK